MPFKKSILVFSLLYSSSILCIVLSVVFTGFYWRCFQIAAFVLSVIALTLLKEAIKTQTKQGILLALKIIRVVTIAILLLSGINMFQVVFGKAVPCVCAARGILNSWEKGRAKTEYSKIVPWYYADSRKFIGEMR